MKHETVEVTDTGGVSVSVGTSVAVVHVQRGATVVSAGRHVWGTQRDDARQKTEVCSDANRRALIHVHNAIP